jgi:voltage-gated potassium channel
MLHNKKIVIGVLTTITFLIIGTIGYRVIEEFTLLDALYMTVITITTVGFGEINPLSSTGRIFTMFLIVFGFGSIGFLAAAFTEAIIEQASSPLFKRKTMQKRIDQLRKHYIICGFGRVGIAAAEHFQKAGAPFVVLESGQEQIKILQEQKYPYLEGDATKEEVLLAAGIKYATALMALLNDDPENLFTVLTARELNPTLHIIARTETTSSESRMLRAGADSIISPYASAGRRVADKILKATKGESPGNSYLVNTQNQPEWQQVTEESDLAKHVVETASTFLKGTILGLRRGERDYLAPGADMEIQLGDQLLIAPYAPLGSDMKIVPAPRKVDKMVLIDDNPVIRRLYTRLFQKAGYHIFTAENGKEGYELILRERPQAAVIDYFLPDMTGLSICTKIRANVDLQHMKLVLFTGNDDVEIRKKALEAGVDSVVVKSPDAAEIVNTVKATMENC